MIKEYEAKIIEEDGKIKDILYKCDKTNNIECKKTNCGEDYCNYTKDKRYAIDFAKGKDIEVTETREYANGEIIRKTIIRSSC